MKTVETVIAASTNKVLIKSLSLQAGNECGNDITVTFTHNIDPNILGQEPWIKIAQWITNKEITNIIRINNIPDTLDADELAEALAEELKLLGKTVVLKKWIAPNRFAYLEYSPVKSTKITKYVIKSKSKYTDEVGQCKFLADKTEADEWANFANAVSSIYHYWVEPVEE